MFRMYEVTSTNSVQAPEEDASIRGSVTFDGVSSVQVVVPVVSVYPDVEGMIYGLKRFFESMKRDIFAQLPDHLKQIILAWLNPQYLQRVTRVPTPADDVWMQAKFAMLTLSDDAIRSMLYATLFHLEANADAPSKSSLQNLHIDYCRARLQQRDSLWSAFSANIRKEKELLNRMFVNRAWAKNLIEEVADVALDMPERLESADDFSAERERNEFVLTYNKHLDSKYSIMFVVAQYTELTRHLQTRSVEVVSTYARILGDPMRSGVFANQSAELLRHFDGLGVGSSVHQAISYLINFPGLSINRLIVLFSIVRLMLQSGITDSGGYDSMMLSASSREQMDYNQPVARLRDLRRNLKDDMLSDLKPQLSGLVLDISTNKERFELFENCFQAFIEDCVDRLIDRPRTAGKVITQNTFTDVERLYVEYFTFYKHSTNTSVEDHVAYQGTIKNLGDFLQKIAENVEFRQAQLDVLAAETTSGASESAFPGIAGFEMFTRETLLRSYPDDNPTVIIDGIKRLLKQIIGAVNRWEVWQKHAMRAAIVQLANINMEIVATFREITRSKNLNALCTFWRIYGDTLPGILPYELAESFSTILVTVNTRLKDVNLSWLFMWEYYFIIPSTLYTYCMLRYFSNSAQGIHDTNALRRHTSWLRANRTELSFLSEYVEQVANDTKMNMSKFFATIPNIIKTMMYMSGDGLHDRKVAVFSELLFRLAKDTLPSENYRSRDDAEIERYRAASNPWLMFIATEANLIKLIKSRIRQHLEEIISGDLVEVASGNNSIMYFRQLSNNNPLLYNFGLHRMLGDAYLTYN